MASIGTSMTKSGLKPTVLLIAGLLLGAGAADAQHRPRRTTPRPIDFATSQNDNLFSLVRSQDDIHELETALQELDDGKNDAAVRRLHELLRADPRGVIPVAPGRFLGIRTAVVTPRNVTVGCGGAIVARQPAGRRRRARRPTPCPPSAARASGTPSGTPPAALLGPQ